VGVVRLFRLASSVVFGLVWAIIIALAVFGFPGIPSGVRQFPDAVDGQAVYDPAGASEPEVEQALESQIDAIEARSGAELAIYVRVD